MVEAHVEKLFKSYSGGKPAVQSSDVDEIVRELGYAPSLKELKEFKRTVGQTCDLEALEGFIDNISHPEDTADNLLEPFKFYDKAKSGKISKQLLQRLLANVGEPLDQLEMEEFFTNTCNYGDQVPYRELVEKLLQR